MVGSSRNGCGRVGGRKTKSKSSPPSKPTTAPYHAPPPKRCTTVSALGSQSESRDAAKTHRLRKPNIQGSARIPPRANAQRKKSCGAQCGVRHSHTAATRAGSQSGGGAGTGRVKPCEADRVRRRGATSQCCATCLSLDCKQCKV